MPNNNVFEQVFNMTTAYFEDHPEYQAKVNYLEWRKFFYYSSSGDFEYFINPEESIWIKHEQFIKYTLLELFEHVEDKLKEIKLH